jgi:hypothetical protein
VVVVVAMELAFGSELVVIVRVVVRRALVVDWLVLGGEFVEGWFVFGIGLVFGDGVVVWFVVVGQLVVVVDELVFDDGVVGWFVFGIGLVFGDGVVVWLVVDWLVFGD